MYDEVVWGNAGLAAVEGLSPGNPSGRDFHIGALVNYAWALASQFQYNRCEMLRCSCHYGFSQGRTSGEEDDVPALLQKECVGIPVPLDNFYVIGGEEGANHLFQHPGYIGYIRGRLEHSSASCRNGSNKRRKKQLYRVVPGSNYKGATQRLLLEVRF